jgi:aminopeptidase N
VKEYAMVSSYVNLRVITYHCRELSLSVDPELDGFTFMRHKNMTLSILCHETCHMWLGNLVTTKWWDTVWLNEGMTQFFTHYVASRVSTETSDSDHLIIQ